MNKVLILILISLNIFATKYTIEDLRVLYNEKSHNEYMNHFLDIRPSKRSFEWKKMGREMATALIEEMIKNRDITKANFDRITSFNRNKFLKSYAFYTLNYSKFAQLYFLSCRNCEKDLDKFIANSARYPDLDFEIYKSLPRTMKNQYDLLVRSALLSNDSIYYCKDPVGREALLKILIDEIDRSDNKDTILSKTSTLFTKDCLSAISDPIVEKLLMSGQYESEIYYIVFKAYSRVPAELNDTFLISYLLNRSKPGETMNLAWNLMDTISANYKKRMKVLNSLKQIRPLPGQIFERRNGKLEQKSKVIIKKFAQNFPEYLNFYADSCISFYSGKKQFNRGNPTRFCNDFMQEEVAGMWLSDTIRLNYSSVKKIK